MAWEWLGPTATAVAGLAGMTGVVLTGLSAHRAQIRSVHDGARVQLRNALLAEKRATYTKSIRICHEALLTADAVRKARTAFLETPEERRQAIREHLSAALGAMGELSKSLHDASSELSIIGSPEYGSILLLFATNCSAYATDARPRVAVSDILAQLVDLLYMDVRREFAWDDGAEVLRKRALAILDSGNVDRPTVDVDNAQGADSGSVSG